MRRKTGLHKLKQKSFASEEPDLFLFLVVLSENEWKPGESFKGWTSAMSAHCGQLSIKMLKMTKFDKDKIVFCSNKMISKQISANNSAYLGISVLCTSKKTKCIGTWTSREREKKSICCCCCMLNYTRTGLRISSSSSVGVMNPSLTCLVEIRGQESNNSVCSQPLKHSGGELD